MKKSILLLTFLSFTIVNALSQNKWRPFAGINVSGSPDLYYVGPSFSAGVIHDVGKKKKWSWAPEVTYFRKSSTYMYSPTQTEKDKFLSYSIRSNFNYRIGKKPGKGVFVGAGIGFQRASDECWTITQTGANKEENMHYDAIRYGNLMITFNAGYAFRLNKNHSLELLLSTIGPHTAKDYLGTYVEVISVISAGARFVL